MTNWSVSMISYFQQLISQKKLEKLLPHSQFIIPSIKPRPGCVEEVDGGAMENGIGGISSGASHQAMFFWYFLVVVLVKDLERIRMRLNES